MDAWASSECAAVSRSRSGRPAAAKSPCQRSFAAYDPLQIGRTPVGGSAREEQEVVDRLLQRSASVSSSLSAVVGSFLGCSEFGLDRGPQRGERRSQLVRRVRAEGPLRSTSCSRRTAVSSSASATASASVIPERGARTVKSP